MKRDLVHKNCLFEGCGKTTLLNFLSGRLIGNNLEVTGELILNGKSITDIDEYSNQIAYVMQDDILLATFTPIGLDLDFEDLSKKISLIFFVFWGNLWINHRGI